MTALAAALLTVLLAPSPGPAPPVTAGAVRTIGHVAQAAPAPVGSRAVWPLDPEPAVAAGFDPPADRWTAGHRGVDLVGAPGQPVRSAIGGVVTFAGTVAGSGVVVVSSGTRRATYQPVAATVRRGAAVGPGDVLGALQPAPSHCAPRVCLHWGLIASEEYLDPLSLLGRGPVRLLPTGP